MRGQVSICRPDLVAQLSENGGTDTGKVSHDAEAETPMDDIVDVVVIEGVFLGHWRYTVSEGSFRINRRPGNRTQSAATADPRSTM